MAMRFVAIALLFTACRPGTTNSFRFCRDFSAGACTEPLAQEATYPLQNSRRDSTLRDFWNSVYFRGDRLAFEITNADARRPVDFDCLFGRYHFGSETADHHEIEYLELREKNVFGLVMLGSLIEKRFKTSAQKRYTPIPKFDVVYSIYCRNDLLARGSITVAMR